MVLGCLPARCVSEHVPYRAPAHRRGCAEAAAGPGSAGVRAEYRHDGSWFTPLFGHATSEATMREEREAAGWRVVQEHGFLARQTFLVLEAATP